MLWLVIGMCLCIAGLAGCWWLDKHRRPVCESCGRPADLVISDTPLCPECRARLARAVEQLAKAGASDRDILRYFIDQRRDVEAQALVDLIGEEYQREFGDREPN